MEERTKRVWRHLLALIASGDASVRALVAFASDPDAALDLALVEREREHELATWSLLEFFLVFDEPETFAIALEVLAIRRHVLGEALSALADRHPTDLC